jgi:hypothetical protein
MGWGGLLVVMMMKMRMMMLDRSAGMRGHLGLERRWTPVHCGRGDAPSTGHLSVMMAWDTWGPAPEA